MKTSLPLQPNQRGRRTPSRFLQQQLALLTIQPSAVPTQQPYQTAPTYYPQPIQPLAAYAVQPPPPPAPVPSYVPINPPTYYQNNPAYGRGGRGGRGRGRGRARGRGRRARTPYNYPPAAPTYAVPHAPAPYGTIPPPPGQPMAQAPRPAAYSNVTKYFNNWNVCCTCEWDVPAWHTSQSCPYKTSNTQHNDGVTRANAKQYIMAGWYISKKGKHKTTLPATPHPNQA